MVEAVLWSLCGRFKSHPILFIYFLINIIIHIINQIGFRMSLCENSWAVLAGEGGSSLGLITCCSVSRRGPSAHQCETQPRAELPSHHKVLTDTLKGG